VVLGDFRLTLGKHVVTGRDAVLWIRTQPATGGLPLNDVEAYVEGDAKVIEPDGGSTSDKSMFVTLHFRGRADGQRDPCPDRPLKDFPLYAKAGTARRNAREAAVGGRVGPVGPAHADRPRPSRPPDRALRWFRPPRPVTAVSAEAQAQKPPTARSPWSFTPTPSVPRRSARAKPSGGSPSPAGTWSVSQGNPNSDLYLEMQAEGAVVFSQHRPGGPTTRESTVPWAPDVKGIEASGGGQEAVTGVFLQGDVVIRRGDRTFRGPSAYYDFTTRRALMVEPVFRAVQEERNIPVFVRASEARILSDREVQFATPRSPPATSTPPPSTSQPRRCTSRTPPPTTKRAPAWPSRAGFRKARTPPSKSPACRCSGGLKAPPT